jgi:hypothetical protein
MTKGGPAGTDGCVAAMLAFEAVPSSLAVQLGRRGLVDPIDVIAQSSRCSETPANNLLPTTPACGTRPVVATS